MRSAAGSNCVEDSWLAGWLALQPLCLFPVTLEGLYMGGVRVDRQG